ncbi:MAG: hypothetical protein L0332_18710 [Chloroflexi bacterium]|nr:hypothetical protein [Chloroflexota bacterium]MCI0579966.1 hypothetical protein [Chloroflexota bacterium]MCI0647502.1 hypothetical protein [Chloroflexota bacterium]MCI0728729.1 hypothetical protein [Chloroflexota bacterium]
MNMLTNQQLGQLKRVARFLVLGLALLSSLACGIGESLLGGGKSAGTVSELWPDVPPLEGATPADLEMPLGFRLIIQAMTRGGIDYIAYTTDQTADAVKDFYTAERMEAEGWKAADLDGNETDQLSCVSDTTDASSAGVLCLFARQEDEKDILLAIVVAENEQTQQTEVFYARIDASQFETPQAEGVAPDGTAPTLTAVATVPSVERALPDAPVREFVYAGANFQVTQAVITNRDPNDPTLTLPDSFHVELTLSAENPTQYTILFEAGLLQLTFNNGTVVEQPFGGFIATRDTLVVNVNGPVAPDTAWEGASLTLDEVGKEPITVPLSGNPPEVVPPISLGTGDPVTAQNQSGQEIQYRVTGATLNLDGFMFGSGTRAPLGQRFLKVTVHVTDVSAGDILAGGGDFRIQADGVLSDMVHDETGALILSQGTETDLTFWFVVPAEAQSLILVANVWGVAAELPLSR